jgi:hypothetical protein
MKILSTAPDVSDISCGPRSESLVFGEQNLAGTIRIPHILHCELDPKCGSECADAFESRTVTVTRHRHSD